MNKTQKGKTMSYAVAINSSGQATIPKDIRDFLNITPGENRLIFDIVKNEVVLKREKSRKEIFLENMNKIRRNIRAEEKHNPAFREARKKYAGMTFNEVRDAYDATPEGKKEFKEKYGIDL